MGNAIILRSLYVLLVNHSSCIGRGLTQYVPSSLEQGSRDPSPTKARGTSRFAELQTPNSATRPTPKTLKTSTNNESFHCIQYLGSRFAIKGDSEVKSGYDLGNFVDCEGGRV